MRNLGVSVFLLLSGCAGMNPLTEPWTDTITLPNGHQAISINCGGIFNSYADCMRKAGDKCPGGYSILDKDYNSTPIAIGGGSVAANPNAAYGAASYTSGDIINRIMIVECANRAKPKFSVF